MNHHTVSLSSWFPLVTILCLIILAASLISGCTGASQRLAEANSTATSQEQATVFTSTPSSVATITPNDKDVGETRVANFDATIAAQVTLSPRPTEPDGPIYIESPIPTPLLPD